MSKSSKVNIGDRFGYWEVREIPAKGPVVCFCLGCFRSIKKIYPYRLRQGVTQSCGCKKQEQMQKTSLQRYGSKNPQQNKEIRKKTKQTMLDRYGASHSGQVKELREKKKQTILKKYNTENIATLDWVKEKRKQTMREKYGVDHALQCEEFIQKSRNTLLSLYGVEHSMYSEELRKKQQETMLEKHGVTDFYDEKFKEKARSTLLQRYGVSNPMKNSLIKEKAQKTLLQRTGYEYNVLNPRYRELHFLSDGKSLMEVCREHKVPPTQAYRMYHQDGEEGFLNYCKNHKENANYLEFSFQELMNSYFPDLQHYNCTPKEARIRRKPDFRLERNGKVLYVNVDGLGIHCNYDSNYHLDLYEQFQQYNLTIFQFRSDEIFFKKDIVKSMILNYFGIAEKLNARSGNVTKISSEHARLFFRNNHLMGAHPSSTNYGLFIGERLVSVMAVKRTGEGIEISRFASEVFTNIRGAFSKILKQITQDYKPKYIESFCDRRYSSGKSYLANDFIEIGTSLGWCWTDGKETFNRLRCTKDEQAQKLGWKKIFDAGQSKYIKKVGEM